MLFYVHLQYLQCQKQEPRQHLYQQPGLIILALIISIIKLIKRDSKGFYKQFITLILIGLLTFLFVGNTSVGKNLNINPILSNTKNTPAEIIEEKEDSEKEETSPDPTVLLSGRNNYFKKTLSKYEQSSIIDKIFGIGYISQKGDTVKESKLVEIDYFDIFFCHGILGALIYILPFAVNINLF